MGIDKKLILNLTFSFFVFLTLNLPSIKLIYSTSIFNIIAFLGIFIFGYIRNEVLQLDYPFLSHRQLRYVSHFMLLWTLMFMLTWLNGNISINHFFQYISVSLFTYGILLYVKKKDYKYIFFFQILWGTSLAYVEATIGIVKNTSLGQHYLTSGVAIASTIVIVMGILFSKEINIFMKTIMVPILVVLISGIMSLSGRAPILLSVIVPVTIMGLMVIFEKNKKKKFIMLSAILFFLIISFTVLVNNLPQNTINRLVRVFTEFENEPRYNNYTNSLRLIRENPLGIGLRGYVNYGLNYPHNIFLEVILSGGIFALIPFVLLLKTIGESIVYTVKRKGNGVMYVSLCMYLFMTWNFSFDLSSSYMLFTSMTLLLNHSELTRYSNAYKNHSIEVEKNISKTN